MTVRQSTRQKFVNWRIDNDGLMRITARILPEGCYPYAPDESPEGAEVGADGMVMQFIPSIEFTGKALRTLEGKPVIVGSHEWRTAENTHSDGLTVGSVAGTPHVEGGCIYADLLITDKEAAEAIQDGRLVEISAAYDGTCELGSGEYQGVAYSAVQHDFRFNHVLLLPEGGARCGHSTRIINQKTEEKPMATKVQRQFGNRSVYFVFQNEDDAKEAERMADEQKTFNGAELQAAMEKANEIQEQIDKLNAERADAMKVIEEQKAQIEALTSAESQDAMAQEAAAQIDAEDAILENAEDEGEIENEAAAEEIKNKVCNAKTFAARRRVMVQNMMPDAGADKWTQEQVDGAFTAMAMRAQNSRVNKAARQKVQNKKPMGGATPKGASAPMTALTRVYNSGARKSGGNKE